MGSTPFRILVASITLALWPFAAAALVVDVLLSAGILASDVVAAGQRGDDGETRRYSVDRDGVKAEVLRLDQKIADAVIRGDSRAGSAEAIAIPAVWGVRLTERAPDGPGLVVGDSGKGSGPAGRVRYPPSGASAKLRGGPPWKPLACMLEARSSQRWASSRNILLRSGLAVASAAWMHSIARARYLRSRRTHVVHTDQSFWPPSFDAVSQLWMTVADDARAGRWS
jgi:hypothetical protein